MLAYILRRMGVMVVVLAAVSVCAFVIIQLPPGDYLDDYIAGLQARGTEVDQAEVEALRHQYGLDRPLYLQYLRWIGKIVRGDMGYSFVYARPVEALLKERLPLTVTISVLTLLFVYAVAVPIGIYSATHQYSFADYGFTVFGFVGLATPNFLLALVMMMLFFYLFGLNIGGLFSMEYVGAPWSFGKLLDLLAHLPVPIVVLGTAGTAGLIRVLRGSLLDELSKQYVITARAKGLDEQRLLFKYPVRVAVNPMLSTVGWLLPEIVSGETIVAIVLGLPTIGPLVFNSLLSQDMLLAGSTIMLLSFLTVVGTLISDLLLVMVDPRIRFEALQS
ncbi:MAG: ABC transporter permease [Spirochaetaceae bacterium]|nr:ABC transporter permease [Spirochaetaceae bacterium]